jgi:predicted nuclease with RNAse H fold
MPLPEAGRVLGVDVGFSPRRRSTGLCVLRWDAREVDWTIACATSDVRDRRARLAQIAGDGRPRIDAVAVDGPLRPRLRRQRSYRACEAWLSRGRFARRGKTAATNSGSGWLLHREATVLARLVLRWTDVAPATHAAAIDRRAIVEAFPNLFLGVLCDDADYPARPRLRRRWTDTLVALRSGRTDVEQRLRRLVEALVPSRKIVGDLAVRGHDAVAALACALTALCLAAGRFVAVGAPDDGYVVLPSVERWGADRSGAPWAWRALDRNAADVTADFRGACVWAGDRLALGAPA